MIMCIVTLFLTAIAVFFTSTSQYPGTSELASSLLPFNYGYQHAFSSLSSVSAIWLNIPAIFATGFGFMFIYGRQMNSMARSGLLPSIFKLRTSGEFRSPYAALIIGSVLSILGTIAVYYAKNSDVLLQHIFLLCILASYTLYIACFCCYVIFNLRYSTLPRAVRNPFGMISSFLGISIFGTGIISVLGYPIQQDHSPVVVFLVYLTLLTLYYVFVGYKTQKLSEEEQKVLFIAYVINSKKIVLFSVPSTYFLSNFVFSLPTFL
jgi:amino acid transporter